ncbi:MAG: FapA family protein [Oscillospiraceae bacterium]|nr:FapA family protein [Oscillospiraceae bacterium]
MPDNNILKLPVDSQVSVTVVSNGSEAYITVEPPVNGGAEITADAIMRKLAEAGVTYGIKADAVSKIADKKLYGDRTLIAVWTPPVNGVDGTITYRYEKKVEIAPVEDEHGFVDYKNLGLVRTVHKGDVIADITLPTEGEPGMDVRGKTLRQVVGKKAAYSIGTNTELTEDGTQIVALIDGNINFKNNAFAIDNVVTIAGDVDASVGNISFVGDVVVKGEVMEGFKISSNANIIVAGNVNGAQLEADGDIIIKKGCINSKVVAHGSVTINFCERSDIKCDGTLTSSNFVICDVYCGELCVKGNTGGLMGGKYTSLSSVELSNIGTKNYTPTMLTIGDNALLAEERDSLMNEIGKNQKSIDDLTLIINFLNEKKKELRTLPEDKEKILGNACRQKILLGVEINRLNKRVDEININLASRQYLTVSCKGYLYPGVKIIINDAVFKAESEYIRTKIKLAEDGVICAVPM